MRMLDYPKVTVPIHDIIIDTRINTRELDEAVIEEYRESIREYGKENWQSFWNEFPRMTESGHLYSGFHTVTAAKREFGQEYKISVVQEGKDWRDAYFHATRMNGTHGRRRTNAEKELSVRRWLEDDEMCQHTNGHIANECQVTHQFVSQVEKRSHATIASRPTRRKFINAKGEEEWIETSKIGTNQNKVSQKVDETESEPKPLSDEYEHFYGMATGQHKRAVECFSIWKETLGLKSLPFYGKRGLFSLYLVHDFHEIVVPTRRLTVPQLKKQIKLWETVDKDIHRAGNDKEEVVWIERIKAEKGGQPVKDKASSDDVDQAKLESETEDYEYKNTYDFAVEKCDKAIQTYEEKQESLGLSELPWYGEGGFFYYAKAELESQDKQLGYVHNDMSINELSKMAKAWESVTNAIKHNANWVKAVVGKEERKAERKRQESIKECRKLVKEAKQRFHSAREKLGFPDLEWEHFITSYAQQQFKDPLFPHVLENAPLDALRDRCRVWASIKSALSPTQPTIWVHEIPEYRKVYEQAVDAVHAAKDTYDAVKKELGFTGLPWHRPNQPTREKRCFRAYAIMEGKMLSLVDPAMDVSIDFLKKLVDLWQTVKQDLETPAEWVKTAAWQYKASLVEEEKAEAQQKARREMDEVFEKGEAAFNAHPLSEFMDFENFASYGEEYIDGDDILEPPEFVVESDADAYIELWQGVIENLEQNTGWVAELLTVMHAEAQDTDDKDKAGTAKASRSGHSLRQALEELHRLNSLEDQVGDGTRHANIFNTTPEAVLALRDLILAESKPELEQPAALQIKPLGPADSTPPEANKPQMEVVVGDEGPSINFKDLDWRTQGNIRTLARASKSLLEEDLPDDFKAILSNLFNMIVDFADSDELLQKILERD